VFIPDKISIEQRPEVIFTLKINFIENLCSLKKRNTFAVHFEKKIFITIKRY